ncbi:hypothetical protein F2P56_009267 [Juglans regia]|uniref:Retrovirus-related Pol polyprotein from transposon TNT 1-94-like beta-barrel domain-containing protein n=1 Tax=Juglans regia TaxID=51240 RepID=A0A833XNU5_JUGRE|nr:hypothetical protein F2P56_009267 [Juglans regia]
MAPSNKTPTTNILTTASHFITIKLTIDNYLLWKAQIVPFLYGHQLYGHVDGSLPMPPSSIKDAPNLEHKKWVLQDKLIMSTLNSSLSDSILGQFLDCHTSYEIWTTFQNIFSAKSSAHVCHTKFQLATLRKGPESVSDYYNRAKSLVASLSAAGHVLSNSKFSISSLAGLGTEYESLVTSLTTRADTISSSQLYSYLLNHESRISYQTQNLLANTSLAAHHTVRHSSSPQSSRAPSRGGRRGRGRGPFTPRPFSPQFNPTFPHSDTRPQCQVCQKVGHTALTCYHCLTTPYPSPSSAPLLANNTSLSTPSPNTTTWYSNTVAFHRFTSEFNNLNLESTPYQGPDQVFIGDGSALPIHHLGFVQIPTTAGNFLLHNLFHVPSISRNLLSVRQFCNDNKVFFEFHSDLFLVKDSRSREVLLQGHVEDGLYAFQSSAVTSSPPRAFLGVRTSAQLWHSRLGHPSPCTTAFILRHFNLPFTSFTSIKKIVLLAAMPRLMFCHTDPPRRTQLVLLNYYFLMFGVMPLRFP